ncbi:uncharacterized protein BKA78DRAFT_318535 [Phyllosticta capitalensis]|uniref:uncharacterized protein n=1 Tax=Phyllosticta capitalensis TaxID=121624 RepID=UPI00312FB0CD
MSDSTSTPSTGATKRPSPPISSYAFLVSSPDMIQRNLPPNVDNKPLARQRRRRTSPEDQKILETEYQKNSKPDRNERLEIVKRVALGEKEVQVWFQNRRQKDNRRSRPLEPHEVQAHLQSLSRDSDVDDAFSSSPVNTSDNKEGTTNTQDEAGKTPNAEDASAPRESAPETAPQPPPQESEAVVKNSIPPPVPPTQPVQPNVATTEPRVNPPPSSAPVAEFGSSQPMPSSQESLSKPVGYLANRRSQSFAKSYEEGSNERPEVVVGTDNQTPARTLKKSGSFVRLSMTEDGKARVVSSEDSPSPPRSQPTPSNFDDDRGSLRRSYSAVGLNDHIKNTPSPSLPWTSNGRSRDSRAWEFWCDSDARNSLTVKANQASSGSAADAIGLIRSTSRSALKTGSVKRSAQLISQPQGMGKRQRLDERGTHRPPLSRATSSLGRLQGGKAVNSARSTMQRSQTLRSHAAPGKDEDGFEIPQTESDKENWKPGALGAGQRRSGTKPTMEGSGGGASTLSSARRRVPLGENTNIIASSGGAGSFKSFMDQQKGLKSASSVSQRRPLGASSARNALKQGSTSVVTNPEEDDELRAFMSGGASTAVAGTASSRPGSHSHSQRTSVSSGEELGCVQGLLKLSQGNWR